METDHLFELCRRMDLRWVVIADRYEMEPRKTITQLQKRYYDVVKRLKAGKKDAMSYTTEGSQPEDDPTDFNFDMEYEDKRRAQLEALFTRTKEEEQEEKKLRAQLRALDAKIKKMEAAGNKKKPKVGKAAVAKVATTAVVASAAGVGSGALLSPASDAKKEAEELEVADEDAAQKTADLLRQSTRAPGVYLRSSRHTLPHASNVSNTGLSMRLLKKMSLVLVELQIDSRPIPTERVCDL